ncbi:hypothetical protein [Pseudopedobacter sp.]|uniref:hypothetical protein n=1 Tax=Pseudopedobacter sp. TaxID=1936787 RepID=UPI003341ABE4
MPDRRQRNYLWNCAGELQELIGKIAGITVSNSFREVQSREGKINDSTNRFRQIVGT